MDAVSVVQKSISTREREVLALVARGCTNVEIGKQLSITHTTVRTHLENIFKKLCVHDRTEAVVKFFFSAESRKVLDALPSEAAEEKETNQFSILPRPV